MSAAFIQAAADSPDPVLALIQAAGIRGFKCTEQQQRNSSSEFTSAAPTDSAEPVLALVRAVGLPGFKCTEQDSQNRAFAAPLTGRMNDESSADPVLALVRAAGIAGFKDAGSSTLVLAKDGSTGTPRSESAASMTATPPQQQTRMSRMEYAIIEIPAGGASALTALEASMGMRFAADANGSAYWSEAPSASGGTSRAFAIFQSEAAALKPLAGALGSTGLRLSVGKIDRSEYRHTGPGASAARNPDPPQLPQMFATRLQLALR